MMLLPHQLLLSLNNKGNWSNDPNYINKVIYCIFREHEWCDYYRYLELILKLVSDYLCCFPETHAGFFFFFLSFHEDTLQSCSIQVANKMYQMHGENPSHSILSGYLNDRYKLIFDHFGWEDQYWLWKWPQLSFSIQKTVRVFKHMNQNSDTVRFNLSSSS